MTLDPQAKKFLDWLQQQPKIPFPLLGAVESRKIYNARPAEWGPAFVELSSVENKTAEFEGVSVPVRVYKPFDTSDPQPVLVFYHGGGMVIGSVEGYDSLSRQIAYQSGCMVISVDYRLAPENKFPCAVDDAWASLNWVINNAAELGVDSARISVGGDSAGGTLAAVVALMAREELAITLKSQLLIYPAVAPKPDSNSQIELGEGYFLERPTILWFHECYQNSVKDTDDFRYGPLAATSHENLPPAYILTAGYDPLKDEGIAYVEKLRAAEVSVEYSHYEGMFHPFVSLAGLMDKGKEAITEVAGYLKKVSQ